MRLATPHRHFSVTSDAATVAISTMGLVLAIAGVVNALAASLPSTVRLLEVFLMLLVPTGLATGGYWLAARNVPPAERWQVTTYVSIGIVITCAVAGLVLGYPALSGGAVGDPFTPLTTLAPIGGMAGFVVGLWTVSTAVAQPSTETAQSSSTGTTDAATQPSGPRPNQVAGDGGVSTEEAVDPIDADLEAPPSTPATAETVFRVLADDRTRTTLSIVYHAPGPDAWTVDQLAAVVAERTDGDVDRTAVALRHATLPRLQRAGAVEWSEGTGFVRAPEHAVFEEGVREATAVLESFEPGTR